MVRYSKEVDNSKAAKARGAHLRVHFKHCREIAQNIRGLKLAKAKKFLEDVLQYKQAVVFTRFAGGVGRHAQGKLQKAPGDKCRWPQKATKVILDLVKNAEANAEAKGTKTDDLVVSHIQANRAPAMRRRTYRAHGRINPYMSSPAHIELILAPAAAEVPKAPEVAGRLTAKQRAQGRVRIGGGVQA